VAGRVGCPSVGQGLGPPKRPGPKTLRLWKKGLQYADSKISMKLFLIIIYIY